MKAIEALAERALLWLKQQRLAPTPENYRLVFCHLDGRQPELSGAINQITDDGVRLTQAQADVLYERFLGAVAANTHDVTLQQDMRHQALRLSDLAATAGAVTRDFGRELTAQLPAIDQADGASIRQLFATAIERAERAERELAVTTGELGQLRQQFEAVRGDAERDALTGLPNRRGIDAYLQHLHSQDRCVSLAICDVDRFKSINDRYGHAVGDRVLKTVASALKESCAPHFVGRWGGEEFVIIAQLDEEACAVLVEASKDELGRRHFRLRENDEPLGRITFSAGVTLLSKTEPDNEAAFSRADALLYQAKSQGRDRVEWSRVRSTSGQIEQS